MDYREEAIECPEKDTCPKVGAIWQNNPQVKENLEG